MTLTFVSNYINHHQIPVAEVLYKTLGDDYHFIQTEEVEEERVALGWKADVDLPYLVKSYENEELSKSLIDSSDIVVFDDSVEEAMIEARIEEGKIVLRTAERCYKEGQWKAVSPRGLIYKNKVHTKRADKPVYLLCEGGYVADDYEIFKAYRNKRYKWGYFTESYKKNVVKTTNLLKILWVGRLIDWKHLEIALSGASYLLTKGVDYSLDIIGTGDMEKEYKTMAMGHGLGDKVSFLGSMSPDKVREKMEESHILLCTSDFKEGWGAVVNEGMNSRCALLASHAMGSVPYLIKHGENGFVYKSLDQNDFNEKLYTLATDENLRKTLGDNAFKTITGMWSPENAANRLLDFCESLLRNDIKKYDNGPLSEAEVIHQKNMYEFLTK